MKESLRERIMAGLSGDTNDPATFDGRLGYWVQGDCIFIEETTPGRAIESYRKRMRFNEIGISHNLGCQAILYFQELAKHEAAK